MLFQCNFRFNGRFIALLINISQIGEKNFGIFWYPFEIHRGSYWLFLLKFGVVYRRMLKKTLVDSTDWHETPTPIANASLMRESGSRAFFAYWVILGQRLIAASIVYYKASRAVHNEWVTIWYFYNKNDNQVSMKQDWIYHRCFRIYALPGSKYWPNFFRYRGVKGDQN